MTVTETTGTKLPSQRTLMRNLARQLDFDRERTCKAFADAEREGKVKRGRNARNKVPEVYAVALWGDGERKGWLREEK
jgi:DNA-binding transcriptional regulator YhcF (GntR family)